MKKSLIMLVSALALIGVSSGVASENNPVDSIFNAKEVGLSIGSGYTVNTASPTLKGAFQNPYSVNLTAGASYFITRNLGLEANVPFYQSKGVSVSEVQAGLLFRIPLSRSTIILKNIAPYVGLGGVYSWNSDNNFAYVAKVGSEFRINRKCGIGVDGQYRNNDFNWQKGSTSVNAYLKLVF